MLFKKTNNPGSDIKWYDITDKEKYINRRKFIKGAGKTALAVVITLLAPRFIPSGRADDKEVKLNDVIKGRYSTDEIPNKFSEATTIINFYEFGIGRYDAARAVKDFRTRPWTLKIDGLVNRPGTIDIDKLIRRHQLEERIYRHRCVEAWSMVIPWVGIPLADIIKDAEPASNAKYIKFTTLYDPEQMPGQNSGILKWPYVEALRLDEAMNPLAILAVGMYGEVLPGQNGAPVRLIVPWKYGFKSIKSIVRISFTSEMPQTTWSMAAPGEYGFYANVNPEVDHPRWSQKYERRIGKQDRNHTIIFNGYGKHVAHLYDGIDLRRFY
jgi:sulfoxide reductase catalytic subunit YedY